MSPQRGELWLLVWVFSRSVSALQQTTVVRWFGSSVVDTSCLGCSGRPRRSRPGWRSGAPASQGPQSSTSLLTVSLLRAVPATGPRSVRPVRPRPDPHKQVAAARPLRNVTSVLCPSYEL